MLLASSQCLHRAPLQLQSLTAPLLTPAAACAGAVANKCKQAVPPGCMAMHPQFTSQALATGCVARGLGLTASDLGCCCARHSSAGLQTSGADRSQSSSPAGQLGGWVPHFQSAAAAHPTALPQSTWRACGTCNKTTRCVSQLVLGRAFGAVNAACGGKQQGGGGRGGSTSTAQGTAPIRSIRRRAACTPALHSPPLA